MKHKMEENTLFRNLVLVIAVVNFAGFTIVPLLILLSADDVIEYGTYTDLVYGALLAGLLIYFSKNSHAKTKYFENYVPAFLVALYFTTILFVFVIKTASLAIVPMIPNFSPYNIEEMQTYVWPALSYILFAWQLYIIYALSKKEYGKVS